MEATPAAPASSAQPVPSAEGDAPPTARGMARSHLIAGVDQPVVYYRSPSRASRSLGQVALRLTHGAA